MGGAWIKTGKAVSTGAEREDSIYDKESPVGKPSGGEREDKLDSYEPPEHSYETESKLLRAIANPARLRILSGLFNNECNVRSMQDSSACRSQPSRSI